MRQIDKSMWAQPARDGVLFWELLKAIYGLGDGPNIFQEDLAKTILETKVPDICIQRSIIDPWFYS